MPSRASLTPSRTLLRRRLVTYAEESKKCLGSNNVTLQRFETEMDNFFALFRRYLNDKAQGNSVYV